MQAKAANGAEDEDAEEDEDYEPTLSMPTAEPSVVPFDYASAPSLVNTSTLWGADNGGGRKNRKKKPKGNVPGAPVNPYDVYSRGMNAPKGLGRSQKGGERSMTFK